MPRREDDRRGAMGPARQWTLSTSLRAALMAGAERQLRRVSPASTALMPLLARHSRGGSLFGRIGKLDEPKSLLWAEPFDDCANGRGQMTSNRVWANLGGLPKHYSLMSFSADSRAAEGGNLGFSSFGPGRCARSDRATRDARSAKLMRLGSWLIVMSYRRILVTA